MHYEKFADGSVKCIEDEIPFELPKGWSWSRLISLSSIITDGEHKTPRRVNEFQGYYLLSARNIQNGFLSLTDVDFVDKSEFENISRRCNPKDNDVLISCSGSIGRVTVINDGNDYVMVRSAAMVRPISINPYYLMFALQSGQLQNQMQKVSKQTAQANLFLGAIQTLLVPLPPETECYRIVLAIDNFLKLVDFVSSEQDRLSELASTTKAKILDLAIRGKLVPQNPDDEPASVLLERICAEKEELIKQGKIKRDKKKSIIFKGEDNSYYEIIEKQMECIDNDIPFELPDNWTWTRLSNVVQILNGDRGQNYPAKNKLQKSGIPFVSASNIESGRVSSQDILCMTDEQYNVLGSGKLVTGDIVYCIRGSLGKCGIFEMEKGAIASSLVIVRPIITNLITTEYIFNYLNSNLAKIEITKYDNGSAQPNLAAKDFMRFLIPIPPSNEQTLINSLLDKLFSYINYIESSLL